MNQEGYLLCHTSGQLLTWVKNKRARIHLIGRGTHPSSNIYAPVPRDLRSTSMFVKGCTRRANRGTEVGRSWVTTCFDITCFDILVYIYFHTDEFSPHFPDPFRTATLPGPSVITVSSELYGSFRKFPAYRSSLGFLSRVLSASHVFWVGGSKLHRLCAL
jgi:hypothetical protein